MGKTSPKACVKLEEDESSELRCDEPGEADARKKIAMDHAADAKRK